MKNKESKSQMSDKHGRKGELHLIIEAQYMDKIKYSADESWFDEQGRLHLKHHNAYVRSGLRNSLLREFNISGGGTAVAGIGVASSTSAVTVDTRFLNGATAGLNGAVSGQNISIKAISPTATIVTDGAGVTQTVTAGATFTNADFFSTGFAWAKIGLTLAVPTSNSNELDGNLVDVIGGTGGSSPYNRTFSLDLTSAGTFSVTAQIAVTASAI